MSGSATSGASTNTALNIGSGFFQPTPERADVGLPAWTPFVLIAGLAVVALIALRK